jgi:hypothetical protein
MEKCGFLLWLGTYLQFLIWILSLQIGIFSGSLLLLKVNMLSWVAMSGALVYQTGFKGFHSECLSPVSSWDISVSLLKWISEVVSWGADMWAEARLSCPPSRTGSWSFDIWSNAFLWEGYSFQLTTSFSKMVKSICILPSLHRLTCLSHMLSGSVQHFIKRVMYWDAPPSPCTFGA